MANSFMKLIINIEKQYNFTTATIYNDNQLVIRKIQSPNIQSGQSFIRNIITIIDKLYITEVEIDFW